MSTTKLRSILLAPQELSQSIDELSGIPNLEPETLALQRFGKVPLLAAILDESGCPIAPLSQYLAFVAITSRGATGDTVRSYAESLLEWTRYLASGAAQGLGSCHHGIVALLEQASEESLSLFRVHQVHGHRKRNGSHLAAATANHRVAVAMQFHRWAQERRVLESPLGIFLTGLPSSSKSRSKQGRMLLKTPFAPLQTKRLPRALNQEEVVRLFLVAKMPYRLLFRWCLVSGIRRFEVCNLRIAQLPTQEQVAACDDGIVRLELIRKGGKLATLHVPSLLMEETLWYLMSERPSSTAEAGQWVFLNSRGRQISRASLTAAFRECANAIGSRATLHHLRHTFAVNVLKCLEQSPRSDERMNSIKTLQVLLGHSSVETTEIYLQAISVTSPDVVNALSHLYGATL